MLTLFFLLFGFIIGSFLNVVVLRSEQSESLGGRSTCPRCGALIHWYDNIPLLSFLLLRGRCRACHNPISWQYPLVELVTGILFLGVGQFYTSRLTQTFDGFLSSMSEDWGMFLTITLWLILVSTLIAILVSDLRTLEIPLPWLWFAGLTGIGIVVAETFFPEGALLPLAPMWESRLIAGGIAALFFSGLVFFSRETWMGMGDVWLAGLLGLLVGGELLLFTLTLSFTSGAVVGVGLLLKRTKTLKSQIAFAPFLILSPLITLWLAAVYPQFLEWFLFPTELFFSFF